MNKVELEKLLESNEAPFLKKLKYAGLNELEYWEKRPENLSREMLLRYMNSIDETSMNSPQFSVRESSRGKYGQTGFSYVFKLRDTFFIMGVNLDIYIKGFFFEVDFPRGVEIQSFKKSTVLTKIK